MKLIIQRVRGLTRIACRENSQDSYKGEFQGAGFVVLMGWMQSDIGPELDKKEEWLISRVEGLRVFPDVNGRMNLSLPDYLAREPFEGGGILWVPQFTLGAELESGFRPSFTKAMEPARAQERFEAFVKRTVVNEKPYRQIFGRFGADMDLSFTNWGPVTIPLEA